MASCEPVPGRFRGQLTPEEVPEMAPPDCTSSGIDRRTKLPPDGPVWEPETPVMIFRFRDVPWPGVRGSLFLNGEYTG
jgi:hypothetical protein